MLSDRQNIFIDRGTIPEDERFRDRQILALDSLSNLINKFSKKFDFNTLIDTFLLILSGQLTTSNIFAAFHIAGSQNKETIMRAIGKYQEMTSVSEFNLTDEILEYLGAHTEPIIIDECDFLESKIYFLNALARMKVRILSPVIHNDRIMGIICVGEKFSGKPYTTEDLRLFSTLINTITPLVASSHHFWAMAKLSAWYSDILNSVKQGVLVFDHDNKLKNINVSAYNILKSLDPGLPHIMSLYQSPIADLFPGQIFNGWLDKFLRARLSLDYQNFKNLVANREEKSHVFNCTISAIAEDSERITDFIITLEDVTEIKESENKLFELQNFAERGHMISSISHELNNYLGMVLGGVELTCLSASRGQHDKTLALLDKLKNSALQMKRFVEGMTDSTKLDTVKQKGSLNRVISDVTSFLAVRKKFTDTNITAELDKDLPDFEFDSNQISQLILNLLNNAADACLESQNRPCNIGIRSSYLGDKILLTVNDNGIGMNDESKNNIFKTKFTTKKDGHGYGLVTCWKIIENHNGQVSVKSELGQGTVISIAFPKVQ